MDNHTQRIDTAAIRALADAASPGPFWWEAYAYSGGGHVYLACRRPGLGVCKVMDFVRWGFGGASPRFWKDGLMERADALSSFDHNRRMTIHNADAEYIPAALTAVPALCDELDALRAKIAKLREYVGGPLVPTGDPAYDNGRDTVRCEVLAILDEVNNA